MNELVSPLESKGQKIGFKLEKLKIINIPCEFYEDGIVQKEYKPNLS